MKIKHIFKGYNYFYKQLYQSTNTFTPRNEKLCESFLALLEKKYGTLESLGEEFLWNYFVFQFSYWSELEIQSFNKRINLAFIIGEKAFKRYLERNVEFDWQMIENERKYSRSAFNLTVRLREKIESNYDCDEVYRQMDYNGEKGLSNCITYTSLYNPSSQTCQSCIYKESCIETQMEIYPKIYRNRKIENESRTTRQQNSIA